MNDLIADVGCNSWFALALQLAELAALAVIRALETDRWISSSHLLQWL